MFREVFSKYMYFLKHFEMKAENSKFKLKKNYSITLLQI